MDIQPLRAARKDAPSIELIRAKDTSFVLKSYLGCSWWIRNFIGRAAIARECWALRKLDWSSHTPNLIGRPNAFTAKIEYIQGTPLESVPPDKICSVKLADEAGSLLDDLYKAGVAHGDLGHDHWQEMGREANLIWTEDQRLVAIDFAGSVPFSSGRGPMGRFGRALRSHDCLLSTKVAHHFPSEVRISAPQIDWPVELWDLLRILGKL